MNRRKLLKLFGIGTTAAVVAPVLAKLPEEPYTVFGSIEFHNRPVAVPRMTATEVMARQRFNQQIERYFSPKNEKDEFFLRFIKNIDASKIL